MPGPSSGGHAAEKPAVGSELGRRLLSGVVLAAAALGTAWLGGPVFALFWLLAGGVIAFEWITMTRAEPRAILVALAAAGLAGMLVAYKLGAGWPAGAAILLLVVVGIAVLAEGARDRGWAVAGFLYAALVALIPPMVRDQAEIGAVAILWMFGVVWTTDVAAYFAGRSLGGPKLAPSISPKKTWSGFLGGVLAATLVGTLIAALWQGQGGAPGLVAVAFASAIAAAASQIGDLAESGLKRWFGAKDSSQLIPGHGGVMDRLDGFAAVALLCGVALAGSRLAR